MRQIEVGKIFEEGKTKFQEGVKFDIDNSGGLLFIFFNNPTPEEIKNVRTGEMKIGLFNKYDILFLLWKFGRLEWMDTPYTIHLSKTLVLEQVTPNKGYGITIFLINASNGILEGLRYISISEKFSTEFYKAVNTQRLDIFEINRYESYLKEIYNTYKTKDMIKLGITEKVG